MILVCILERGRAQTTASPPFLLHPPPYCLLSFPVFFSIGDGIDSRDDRKTTVICVIYPS